MLMMKKVRNGRGKLCEGWMGADWLAPQTLQYNIVTIHWFEGVRGVLGVEGVICVVCMVGLVGLVVVVVWFVLVWGLVIVKDLVRGCS